MLDRFQIIFELACFISQQHPWLQKRRCQQKAGTTVCCAPLVNILILIPPPPLLRLRFFRSLALMVWDLWCFEELEKKNESINQSVNDGGVCRTARATLGLLNRICSLKDFSKSQEKGLVAGIFGSVSLAAVSNWPYR